MAIFSLFTQKYVANDKYYKYYTATDTINHQYIGSWLVASMSLEYCQGSLHTYCCRASPILQLGFLVLNVMHYINPRFTYLLTYLHCVLITAMDQNDRHV